MAVHSNTKVLYTQSDPQPSKAVATNVMAMLRIRDLTVRAIADKCQYPIFGPSSWVGKRMLAKLEPRTDHKLPPPKTDALKKQKKQKTSAQVHRSAIHSHPNGSALMMDLV